MRIIKIILLFLITVSSKGYSQMDTVEVQDFNNEWKFYNGSEMLPLVNKEDFKGNIISFQVDKSNIQNAIIQFSHPKKYSIFIDNELIKTSVGTIDVNPKELRSEGARLVFSVFSNELNPYLLKTSAIKLVEETTTPLVADIVIVNPRTKEAFNDFYILAWLTILIYLAVLLSFYPRALSEYFKVSRALSPRELDENLLKTRIFTGVNISFYIFISLSLGLLIYSSIHLANLFPEQLRYYPNSVFNGLGNWLVISFLVLTSILVKYVVLNIFTGLFQLKDFLSNHFYNSLRLSLIIAMPLNFLVGLFYFSLYQYPHNIYSSFYTLLLYANILIVIIIYIKLMNSASYKNLHLFSYLCGTELIPYVIILSLGIY